MSEFKGTKGEWQLMKADSFGIPYIVYVKDETIFKCYNTEDENDARFNSLLISKAPEMLEMLIDISEGNSPDLKEINKLIKEATEL